MNKKAFTLAEVLITLTIIGVIAALTIPNLMQSYRKHERVTQIKAAYSIIQNAVRLSVAENGDVYTWQLGNGANVFAEKYILPYLKIQYNCQGKASSKVQQKQCFIQNNDKVIKWKLLNGKEDAHGEGYGAEYSYALKLQNGMDLAIWAPDSRNRNVTPYVDFVFDVNGGDGTTTAGVDVFSFQLNLDTGKFATGSSTVARSNYNDYHDVINSTKWGACNTTDNRFAGMGCARVIELNGWEFPKDYPVKI